MIPVEFFWLALVVVFGIIGATRGIWKELGVTTILLLSLFVLKFGWEKVGSQILAAVHGRAPSTQAAIVEAAYYSLTIVFVAYISYEGVTLEFPLKKMKGPMKGVFGALGGLLNGYLIIGTLWDVANKANYFGLKVPLGSSMVAINSNLTQFHKAIAQYLPITFMNEFVMLVLGMILLLAIVLK
jgi:uncharacterized membrane protein required for colicin V production